uniref:F5/8 type C domain-containing protein n=1 Tax=Mycobacterium riyadhense TaxID=486698 RepID=A0A653F3W8_9MYCO|nr:hypothetical protein BIN_B_05283 [Mycobacterium riyadhense]
MSTRVNDEWLHDIGVLRACADAVGTTDAHNPEIAGPAEDLGMINNHRDAAAAVNLDANDDGAYGAAYLDAHDPGASGHEATNDGGAETDEHSQQAQDCPTLDQPSDDGDAEPKRPRRFTPWVAGVFGGAVALATVLTTAGVSLLGARDAAPPPQPVKASLAPHPVAPPPATPSALAESADQPLPFTASADCPPGSTTAQSVADPDKPTPWICIRHTDGQPLSITLGPAGMERSYVITAVSIVPGDITPAQGTATEPWLRHRVVTRLQWQFNDTANTVLTQNTGNIHGEAVLPVPRVNASKITVIIQETSRPPASTATSTPPGGHGGIFEDILAPPPADPTLPTADPGQFDPSDTTFAVTSIKIIGHRAL